MTGLLPFPSAVSLTAVQQTLDRLINVSHYLSDAHPSEFALANSIFRTALDLEEGGAARLTEALPNVRALDVSGIRHLDPDARGRLAGFLRERPRLRMELQSVADQLERSIGIQHPLRITVFPEMNPENLPERGISLFLSTPVKEAEPALPTTLQALMVRPPAPFNKEEDETVRIDLERTITSHAHAAVLQNHFARKDIEELAAYEIPGARVTPLSSPSRLSLTDRLVRFGRFTFLGLERPEGSADIGLDLEAWRLLKGRVDVLAIGARAASEPSFTDLAIETLRPSLALLGAVGAAPIRRHHDTTVLPISPGRSAVLELSPYPQTILCDDSPLRVTRDLNRSAQILNLLEEIRGEVARDLGQRLRGRMAALTPGQRAQDAWLWASFNLNGAILMALRYLLLLDSDPYRFATLAAREEALARIIDEAIGPLQIHHWGPNHVWAFKELLLRSGLLERPATTGR